MSDLIDRQAAIDAVSNWLYDRDDGRSVDQLLSTLPSVQPQRQTGKWIPVTERLPENDDKVLCCTVTTKGIRNIVIGYYMERWCCGMNSNVIAWQYLPEPYKDGGGA